MLNAERGQYSKPKHKLAAPRMLRCGLQNKRLLSRFDPDRDGRRLVTEQTCARYGNVNSRHPISASSARALRTSLVASPPSICARIGSNSARGSLGEPVSRQRRARSIAARSSSRRDFLAAGDVDRFEETSFRPRPVRLQGRERDLALNAMQVRKPEPLARLIDKGESLLQRRFGARSIAGR